MEGSKKGAIILGDYAIPEIEYLKNNLWLCTEKIDGTNIGIRFDGSSVEFQGRTETADIPANLVNKLKSKFTKELMSTVFKDEDGTWDNLEVVVFGEGFGAGIQKGGNYIPSGVDFILFDVWINGWWLNRERCEDIAKSLGVMIVPVIGIMTLDEAEKLVISGFKSTISDNKDYIAEGLVCKPLVEVHRRNGDRILTKIKYKDYKRISKGS
jgi:hypothetical protein